MKRGAALTPPIDAGLLAGITREFLFEMGADTGIPVREQVLKDDDLFGADEAFLTSTTREVVPIVRVDNRRIGAGIPDPLRAASSRAFAGRPRRSRRIGTWNSRASAVVDSVKKAVSQVMPVV